MRIANAKIRTYTQRRKLTARAAPYFQSIAPCRLLGYVKRPGETIPGRWVVQVETGTTEAGNPVRRRHPLGTADDLAAANGTDVLSYEQAYQKACGEWNPDGTPRGTKAGACTMSDAIEQHGNFDGKNGDKTSRAKEAAVRNLRYSVLGIDNRTGEKRPGVAALDGNLPVNDLTDEMLKDLRDSWIDDENLEASRASALRKWTDLHSCLQQAFLRKSNAITSPAAWQTVPKMKQTFKARLVHFSHDQAVDIIGHARGIDAPVADYLEGLYRTGARPGGELMTLEVRDFDAAAGTLGIHGRSETNTSKTGERPVGLSPLALAFFSRLTAGRRAGESMFNPEILQRGRIKRVLVEAVRAVLGQDAPNDDADIVPYAFRHTFISRRAGAGMSAGQIAEVCGTSEYMIEKTYKKMFKSEVAAALAASDPKPAPRPELRVVEPMQEAA